MLRRLLELSKLWKLGHHDQRQKVEFAGESQEDCRTGFNAFIPKREKDLLGSQTILAVELFLLELAVLAVHKAINPLGTTIAKAASCNPKQEC